MKQNEKLKLAALEAELKLLDSLPDESEAEWTPSEEFKAKINELLSEHKPERFTKRRIVYIIAAVLLLALAFAVVPFLMGEPEYPDISDNSNSNGENISGILSAVINDTDVDITAKPEYIPEGYTVNSCTVWADGSLQIEYINGNEQIYFRSYPADEVDLSAFETVIGNVDINGNTGFYANNLDGMINNNLAWNSGNYSYIITNADGVPLDEMVRIALSVKDIDKSE